MGIYIDYVSQGRLATAEPNTQALSTGPYTRRDLGQSPSVTSPPTHQDIGITPAGAFLFVGASLLIACLLDERVEEKQVCGLCARPGHNRLTCPYGASRVTFPRTIPKSSRCECCGQYGYKIQRHHTRGRGNASDALDVCGDCHMNCCHGGNFQNLASKPRNCTILDRPSFWCR